MEAKSLYYEDGHDILAAILYYSKLPAFPLEPGIEPMLCEAVQNHEKKHGKIVCNRCDNGVLLSDPEKHEILTFWEFVHPKYGNEIVKVEYTGFHLADNFKETVERLVIPYLIDEEKSLTQGLGEELAKVAEKYPTPKRDVGGLIEIVRPIICYRQSVVLMKRLYEEHMRNKSAKPLYFCGMTAPLEFLESISNPNAPRVK